MLKQNLTLYSWLAWTLLGRPGWLGAPYVDQAGLVMNSQKTSCLYLLSTGIKCIYHQTQLKIDWFYVQECFACM